MASLGRISRIDRPSKDLLAFSLRTPGSAHVLVAGLRAPAFALGLVPTRPRGAAADSFTQGLRRRLDGAELTRVWANEAGLWLEFRGHWPRAEHPPASLVDGALSERTLWVSADGPITLKDEHEVLFSWRGGQALEAIPRPPDDALGRREHLEASGPQLVDRLRVALLESGRGELLKVLRKSERRLGRKRAAIEKDARRADAAPALRLDADLLLANASRVRRAPNGAGSVPVDDWSQTPPLSREIALERHESPPERAQKLYHQARRMERGAEMAERRWLQVEEQLEALATLRAEVLAAEHQRALDRARERAQAMGLRELDDAALPKPNGAATKKRRGDAKRAPYRRFVTASGQAIWVGRSARENDALTLHHARGFHLWLHVEGRAGAHVVVPIQRGQQVESETLVDAAHLAAHFSDARDDAVVEVIYAERRHVVKPRGYALGAVRVDRRKTLNLRQESARLSRLLASELRV